MCWIKFGEERVSGGIWMEKILNVDIERQVRVIYCDDLFLFETYYSYIYPMCSKILMWTLIQSTSFI